MKITFYMGNLITILFIFLKLDDKVNWPWWSFNPFQASVFVQYVWVFWLLLICGVFMVFKNDRK
jgi:phosphatidylserine synthase